MADDGGVSRGAAAADDSPSGATTTDVAATVADWAPELLEIASRAAGRYIGPVPLSLIAMEAVAAEVGRGLKRRGGGGRVTLQKVLEDARDTLLDGPHTRFEVKRIGALMCYVKLDEEMRLDDNYAHETAELPSASALPVAAAAVEAADNESELSLSEHGDSGGEEEEPPARPVKRARNGKETPQKSTSPCASRQSSGVKSSSDARRRRPRSRGASRHRGHRVAVGGAKYRAPRRRSPSSRRKRAAKSRRRHRRQGVSWTDVRHKAEASSSPIRAPPPPRDGRRRERGRIVEPKPAPVPWRKRAASMLAASLRRNNRLPESCWGGGGWRGGGSERVSQQASSSRAGAYEGRTKDSGNKNEIEFDGAELTMVCGTVPVVSLEKGTLHSNASNLLQAVLCRDGEKAISLFDHCVDEGPSSVFARISKECLARNLASHDSELGIVQVREEPEIKAVGTCGNRSMMLALALSVAINTPDRMSSSTLPDLECPQFYKLVEKAKSLVKGKRS